MVSRQSLLWDEYLCTHKKELIHIQCELKKEADLILLVVFFFGVTLFSHNQPKKHLTFSCFLYPKLLMTKKKIKNTC